MDLIYFQGFLEFIKKEEQRTLFNPGLCPHYITCLTHLKPSVEKMIEALFRNEANANLSPVNHLEIVKEEG